MHLEIAAQLHQQVQDTGGRERVQARRRVIEEAHRGLDDHGAREATALAHTTRQLVGALVARLPQTHRFETLLHLLLLRVTADAALLRNRVTGIADLIGLSQATLGNIWQNIAIALGLKAVFLVTTLFGITTLWMAILADTGATVLVTANALRLLTWRGTRDK